MPQSRPISHRFRVMTAYWSPFLLRYFATVVQDESSNPRPWNNYGPKSDWSRYTDIRWTAWTASTWSSSETDEQTVSQTDKYAIAIASQYARPKIHLRMDIQNVISFTDNANVNVKL